MSAMASDAERTAIRVIGRYFMNSPTIPVQNMRGKNATRVVRVEAVIGQAMREAAAK